VFKILAIYRASSPTIAAAALTAAVVSILPPIHIPPTAWP
jgi:hypothetical protein